MYPKVYTSTAPELKLANPSNLTLHDEDMLERATGLAKVSSCSPHKLGAIVFRRGKVIGRGWNQTKSHPLQAKFNRYSIRLHAEVAAIVDCLRENPDEIQGSSIAVSRVGRKGTLGCSLPCASCLAAIKHVGINRIVCYGVDDTVTAISV